MENVNAIMTTLVSIVKKKDVKMIVMVKVYVSKENVFVNTLLLESFVHKNYVNINVKMEDHVLMVNVYV